MAELFRLEAESQTRTLTASLLALEQDPTAPSHLEACMRAAHSLKGAARLVGLTPAIGIAHAMEDCFVAAQRGDVVLRGQWIDLLLEGVDLLTRTASPAPDADGRQHQAAADRFIAALADCRAHPPAEPAAAQAVAPDATMPPAEAPAAGPVPETERVLRVTADNFNRLLGLASESLVESRRLKPFFDSFLRLKRLHQNADRALDALRDTLARHPGGEQAETALWETQTRLEECRHVLADRMAEMELFDSRYTDLARRLYDEALACRMRPFSDGLGGFPKMVRGLARSLGKQIRLQIDGAATPVDRDILETLESALTHLLRNAADHGIEMPDIRRQAGKPAEGTIRLLARHSAGMLQITVADDGGGIDLDRLRQAIVDRNLTNQETAQRLTEAELLEFLFLPGFTMKATVTEVSGRGVGLDAVRAMVKQVRGALHVSARPGLGTSFVLQLPLTLSVMRTLLVDIGDEAYAFPLVHIVRALKLSPGDIGVIGGRQHFGFEGQQVGLIGAHRLLGGRAPPADRPSIPVVVIREAGATYGLIVDRFLGERDTVVQPLDPRLGKIADIMAGGVMQDGLPVLIVDVLDLLRSADKLIASGLSDTAPQHAANDRHGQRKRVLVVDDSLTVRELERKLLDHAGYQVETAVDGMDGWNIARTGRFDLVITDVDMPRMNGIDLVRMIKKDAHLKSLPVMIVSYKDSADDNRAGLEAGADYYLAKSSFHDETLLQSVVDLIGEPVA